MAWGEGVLDLDEAAASGVDEAIVGLAMALDRRDWVLALASS